LSVNQSKHALIASLGYYAWEQFQIRRAFSGTVNAIRSNVLELCSCSFFSNTCAPSATCFGKFYTVEMMVYIVSKLK